MCEQESCLRHYGGYSVGVPPLPIPNREVKPVRADGTAYSGRVGSRRPFKSKCRFGESISSAALLFYSAALPFSSAALLFLSVALLSPSAVLLISLHLQVGCFRMVIFFLRPQMVTLFSVGYPLFMNIRICGLSQTNSFSFVGTLLRNLRAVQAWLVR